MIWRSDEFFRTPYFFLIGDEKDNKICIRPLCCADVCFMSLWSLYRTAQSHRSNQGCLEIKDGIGDWDAEYLVEHGYFCLKHDMQLNSLAYMSPDKSDKIGLLATRSERIPT